MSGYIIGLDLGQAQDYTAISILEDTGGDPATYHARHLERVALKTPYPAIVAKVAAMMEKEPLKGTSALVVDATGVGAPVVELLRAAGCNPFPVWITGGDAVSMDWVQARVPKRDLVSSLQILLQSGRLKVAASLPNAETLVAELLNFKVTIDTKTAHDSYGAWREGVHDDLVLSVALACWYAGHKRAAPGCVWI